MTTASGVNEPIRGAAGLSRRAMVALMLGVPTTLGACGARSRAASTFVPSTSNARTFTVEYGGVDVRCLFAATSYTAFEPGGLALILLHGANADASQWTDIGLTSVIDSLAPTDKASGVVAVAPDIGDHSTAAALVVDSVLPAVIDRFGAASFGISGISRGAAGALQSAVDEPTRFRTVGLHSPAINLAQMLGGEPWKCWIDIGTDDGLADSEKQIADSLRQGGTDVVEHRWPGGHNRAYWRAHLADYIGFHVNAGAP